MAVWGAIATALFCMTFVTTNERVEPPAKQETNLVAELGDLARNGPWMVMFLLGVLVMTSFWIRSATTVYYFKYFVNRDSLFEWFAISGTFASILGIGLTAPLARLVGGKKRLYMALMAIGGLLTLLFYVIPPDRLALIFGLNILIGIVLGPQAPLVWAMYADTADYSEWKTGRRATGLVFSAATFALKLGGALAGWVTGQLLTRFGYVANQAQTAESLYGILVLMSVLPGMLGIMAAVAVLLYKLDDGLMTEIEAELLARRLASEPSVHRAASGASQA
jgi:GPH family glycoside/pentoside/hexuronide:cation symporter